MGLAKWKFMTSAEVLIHGDLHTGSVMVRGSGADLSAKAIDPEFSFYGPVAYDLGALWANYAIAAARALALDDDGHALWCLGLASRTWSAFASSFTERWPQRQSPQVFTEEFRAAIMKRWCSETWLFAAAKMAGRIVGLAKTSDIETLPLPQQIGAARGVLRGARMAVRERHVDPSPELFAERALAVLAEHTTPQDPRSRMW